MNMRPRGRLPSMRCPGPSSRDGPVEEASTRSAPRRMEPRRRRGGVHAQVAETLALVPRGAEIVTAADDPNNIKQEIRRSMVETSSQPAATIDDLHDDLLGLRRTVSGLASEHGCRVAAAGSHPFSSAEEQEITDTPRYRYVAGLSGWVGRRATAVFGTHVHVAVGSAEKAIGVMEALLPDLPALIALSATSPVWEGRDTGFASARLAVRAGVAAYRVAPAVRVARRVPRQPRCPSPQRSGARPVLPVVGRPAAGTTGNT